MTKRSLFQVALNLMGIFFVVNAFASIASIGMFILVSLRDQYSGANTLDLLLPWAIPVTYMVAGFLLITKSETWSNHLFSEESNAGRDVEKAADPPEYFEVGIKLLGAYFLTVHLPNVVDHIYEITQDRFQMTNTRGFFATLLVIATAIVFLFRSKWVAELVGYSGQISPDQPDDNSHIA